MPDSASAYLISVCSLLKNESVVNVSFLALMHGLLLTFSSAGKAASETKSWKESLLLFKNDRKFFGKDQDTKNMDQCHWIFITFFFTYQL